MDYPCFSSTLATSFCSGLASTLVFTRVSLTTREPIAAAFAEAQHAVFDSNFRSTSRFWASANDDVFVHVSLGIVQKNTVDAGNSELPQY